MAKKKQRRVDNPFVYQGYEGPEYFCDREQETENLMSALRNGRNITLIAPRKIGKTGLISHTFQGIKSQEKDAVCIYIDIFHTKNLTEFVETFGKAVIEEAIQREKSFATRLLDFLKGLRPTITPDLLTGMPTVSINVVPAQAEYTLKALFTHLESLSRPVYLAIDEFQQIAEYPDMGTEAMLRSHIQFVHNVGFIFSGSKKHMMEEMFCSPNRPFYQSTQIMNLNQLDEDVYYAFAQRLFEQKHGSIQQEVFHEVYQRFDGYTWYIQAMLNRMYEREKNVNSPGMVTDAILFWVNTLAPTFETLVGFLTDNQYRLLKAIADADVVQQPQSNEFISRYELPSSSSIKTALDTLTEKDLVYRTAHGYIVYDRFLAIWLRCR